MLFELNQKLFEYYDKYPLWGILLFTEAHPHVIKILKDTDYFNALNEISGRNIAIFATMLFRGEYVRPQIKPNSFSDLIPVWDEPNKNKEILSWFDVKDGRELPLIVLFMIEGNNLYHQKYSIESNSSEEVFKSLKDVLSLIPRDKNVNKKKLFKQMQWEIKKLKTKQILKKIFEALSLFRGASGL